MAIRDTEQPVLYEINTRVWLKEFAARQRNFTLAQVPDSALDEIAHLSFDLVWLMGVWQTGALGRALALKEPNLQREYTRILPDFAPEDVLGSPYSIQDYRVAGSLGGAEALAALRYRLRQRGIRLILDFVPNHTARDHPWVFSHPEYYILGDEEALQSEPQNFFSAETAQGKNIIAHGRDPHFSGWTDTAQLNYANLKMRRGMIETLVRIAAQCDGVRCDVAMLLLDEVFSRTWGERAKSPKSRRAAGEFWTEAIRTVRRLYPDFVFIAEVYWGLESKLQALGFDYTYDKSLYDRLLHQDAGAVRNHLCADLDYQQRSVRFLENHDEPRISEVLPPEKHRAAALICYTIPGMRFFHEGQLDGRKIKVPVQLGRRPKEEGNGEARGFYEKLLAELGGTVMRRGKWQRLEARSAWEGNDAWEQFVIHQWDGEKDGSRIVAVNFGSQRAQCYVSLEIPGLEGRTVKLNDLLNGVSYERDGDSSRTPGLYLDMGPYQTHLFTVIPSS